MCGIAGYWLPPEASPASRPAPALAMLAAQMGQALKARGPDDGREWVDEAAGLALAFRRLAILDLSPAGSQPMRSATGRYMLVFNGEAYNHADLRRDLASEGAAPLWRGSSDTEVVLAAIEAWGITGAVRRIDGMFALAVWDREAKRLTLARDLFGEKPLYYGRVGDAFAFASTVAPLRRLPGFDTRLSREAVAQVLRVGCVQAPTCIYASLRALPPGRLLEVEAGRLHEPRLAAWATLGEELEAARADPWRGSMAEACDAVAAELRASVALRLRADVPVGVLLSGGIDSSLVTSLLPPGASARVFTASFPGTAQDESPHAAAVARHLGRAHTVLPVTAQDALDLVPRLADLWDEPFADSSQVPTALVMRLAAQHVRVVLTGDGGDELFAGYPWHVAARRGLWWWRQLVADLRARGWRPTPAAVRVQRNVHAIWRRLPLVPDALSAGVGTPSRPSLPPGLDRTRALQALDMLGYLPDDLLAKTDRASMGVGLEARAPLLSRAMLRLASRLPTAWMVESGRTKHLLREVLRPRVPPAIVERPKQGFSIPLEAWLAGPLRAWASDLLSPARLERQRLLDPVVVDRARQGMQAGQGASGRHLWAVLMLQAWLDSGHGPASRVEVA